MAYTWVWRNRLTYPWPTAVNDSYCLTIPWPTITMDGYR